MEFTDQQTCKAFMTININRARNKNCQPAQKGFKNISKNLLFAALGSTAFFAAGAQMDKRLVQADEYFAKGEYYTAARLYDQFLNPSINVKQPTGFPLNNNRNSMGNPGKYANNLSILFQEAESFRLANYLNDAAVLFLDCYKKDSVQFSKALYWYAVCQRGLGNFALANESLQHFESIGDGTDVSNEMLQKEKETLAFISAQIARPDSVLYTVKKTGSTQGNEKGIYAPFSKDGNVYFFTSTQTDSTVKAGANPNHNRIFQSLLHENGWQNTQAVSINGSDLNQNQGTPALSADGKYLYFTQWTKEKGKSLSAIYYASKTDSGWSLPSLLPLVNQTGDNSKQPFCSADGKYLFFASDREGGEGNFDIWLAPLNADGTVGEVVNAGTNINSSSNDQAPFISVNGQSLVFASDRTPGMGGFDLYESANNGADWLPAKNMGHPVNSSRDDVYFFSASSDHLLTNALVSTDRGMECCLDTYQVTKAPKKKMLVGYVQDCNNNIAVSNAAVDLKDAEGNHFSTTTDSLGRFVYELKGKSNAGQFSVQKEWYNDKNVDLSIASANEAGWLVDTLYNAPICMDKKIILKVENVVTVYFDYDRSSLRERSKVQMDSIYAILTEDTTATVQISGYTDGKGSVEYNKKLSDRRAKSCADYLIEKGIDPARISFFSFGSCCPVEMELINGRDNPDAREANRRALINISRKGQTE